MMSVDKTISAEVLAGSAQGAKVWARWLGPIAVGIALFSALLTFVVLAGFTRIVPTHQVVVGFLLANALAALFLVAVIGREVWMIIQARRRGRAAAQLHVSIVGLFSVIAAVPAILVAIVASITLDRGLDRIFNIRTRAVIENSLAVSEAYLREHAQATRNDIFAISNEVARAKPLFDQDRDRFRQFLTAQASLRGLPAAVMIDKDLQVIERSNVRASLEFIAPAKAALENISETEPQIALIPDANYVAAVIKLRNFTDTYLYIARNLDPRVVAQVRETRASVLEYAQLEARRLGVQVAFGLMYTVIALIVLLSAVWIGLNFANRLVAPIRRLIGAANVVSTGNLHVQVPVRQSEGDLAQLGETFNKMTQELRTQRDDLLRARDLIDIRRRFTEAVLAGASAGVIGVDPDGHISILNRSAEQLIEHSEAETLGQHADRNLSRNSPNSSTGVPRTASAAGAGADHHQSRGTRAQSIGARDQRTISRGGSWLCRHARRHHGSCQRAADVGLGRCRPPYRARDQESTDAHSAFSRTVAPQIWQSDHRGSRDFRAMHGHDRAAGRRYSPHGRRILSVFPHAQAGHACRKMSRTPSRQAVFLMRVGHADIDIDAKVRGRAHAGAL